MRAARRTWSGGRRSTQRDETLAKESKHDLENEKWNAYGQFTYIYGWKQAFAAPYTNANGSINSLPTVTTSALAFRANRISCHRGGQQQVACAPHGKWSSGLGLSLPDRRALFDVFPRDRGSVRIVSAFRHGQFCWSVFSQTAQHAPTREQQRPSSPARRSPRGRSAAGPNP
jgi:hypothetical protein